MRIKGNLEYDTMLCNIDVNLISKSLAIYALIIKKNINNYIAMFNIIFLFIHLS